MLAAALLGLALVTPPRPVAWVGSAFRGQREVRIAFSLSIHGNEDYGPRDDRGCWTPDATHAAALGKRLGTGEPLRAGDRVQVILGPGNVAVATLTRVEACWRGIFADASLPVAAPGGAMFGVMLVLPAQVKLRAWDGAGVRDIQLAAAERAAVIAQLNAALPKAVAAARKDPAVARQLKGMAGARARARISMSDRAGEMTEQVLTTPGQPKLLVVRVQLTPGGAAFDFVRADWYTPCPGGCAGPHADRPGVGASLIGWFTPGSSPKLVELDIEPEKSKFMGWGVGVPGDWTLPVSVAPLPDGRSLLLLPTYRGDGSENDIYLFDPRRGIGSMERIYSICECGD